MIGRIGYIPVNRGSNSKGNPTHLFAVGSNTQIDISETPTTDPLRDSVFLRGFELRMVLEGFYDK
jgi:hypothetical protein